MPPVLTTGSTVGCGHAPGKVSTSSTAKLRVGTNAVLIETSIKDKGVSACSTVPSDKTSQCTTVKSVASGLSQKLTAGGQPVALATIVGLTDGKPPGTLSATPAQSKLTAT